MRRAVLYLSILSVPPAFSIAGATREAKIALSIDLKKHHVYETTDAEGNTVYYAHKDSL